MTLDPGKLSDWQWSLAERAKSQPAILRNFEEKFTAHVLTLKRWGTVEPGASGETIFRLNQAGSDAMKGA